jgi:hypothetical protein
MLTKILYSYFTLGNLTSLAQKIHQFLVSKFPDHPMISNVLTTLAPKLETSLQSVGSTTKQPLTKIVREADRTRDDSYISLKDHIQAGLRRQDETYRQACEALWELFEKNDLKLYNLANGDESAAIDSLVKDLHQEKNQAFLETVYVVEWLEELVRDNQAFKDANRERSAIRSADETVTDAVAFEQMKVSLDLLSNVLAALYAMNDLDGIREAVNEVNQYISEANASARQSQSRPVPKEAEPE